MAYVERHRGQSRLVVLVGNVAVKVPWIKRVSVLTWVGQILQGRNCNKAERAAWDERKFSHLCPLLYADRYGWIVMMRRAMPMTDDEFDAWFASDCWPYVPNTSVPYELSAKDAGFLPDGTPVMVDYGMRGYEVDLSRYLKREHRSQRA